jgi:hypothetical protein
MTPAQQVDEAAGPVLKQKSETAFGDLALNLPAGA